MKYSRCFLAILSIITIVTFSLFSNAAHAEYRIMQRSKDAHIVLLNSKCVTTHMFIANNNEKVGFIVDGDNKTPGCWYQKKDLIVFTFIASGITLYYDANKFKYIGPSNYVSKYGQLL